MLRDLYSTINEENVSRFDAGTLTQIDINDRSFCGNSAFHDAQRL